MTEHVETHDALPASISWAALSDQGRQRSENQDSFYANEELTLFMVSDGMGGHRGGKIASRIVVEDLPVLIENRLHKIKSAHMRSVRHALHRAIRKQNRHMYLEGHSESGYADMGATLVIVLIRAGRVYIANVGDSQAFRIHSDRMAQVTRDHTVISELLEAKKIDESQVEDHPALGQITQYIGMQEEVAPHVRSFPWKNADALLLCSDGLTDMVTLPEIIDIIKKQEEPQKICQTLIKAANDAGGHDNITVMYIKNS